MIGRIKTAISEFLCNNGFHKYEWAPYAKRTFFGSTFGYGKCKRCSRKFEIFETARGHTIIKEVEDIPQWAYTGKEE